MSDDEPFGVDFGSFDDFLKDMKPGQIRPLTGILRYRQGSDPLDWKEAGAQKYLPGGFMMMTGAIMWEGAAATDGVVEFNFATDFGNNPLFLCSPYYTWPLYKPVRFLGMADNIRVVDIWWWSEEPLTKVGFVWLAMGPVGV